MIVKGILTVQMKGGERVFIYPKGSGHSVEEERLGFQFAEVLVSREMLGGILERIGRLRPAPG